MWAFSDESERAATMLVGVLCVPAGAVPDARRELRSLLLAGQRQVHTAKESDCRRRLLLDTVSGLDATAVVYRYRRQVGMSRVEARSLLLTAAGEGIVTAGVSSWVLDSQDPAQASRDRHTLDTVLRLNGRAVYDHRPAVSGPLLCVRILNQHPHRSSDRSDRQTTRQARISERANGGVDSRGPPSRPRSNRDDSRHSGDRSPLRGGHDRSHPSDRCRDGVPDNK